MTLTPQRNLGRFVFPSTKINNLNRAELNISCQVAKRISLAERMSAHMPRANDKPIRFDVRSFVVKQPLSLSYLGNGLRQDSWQKVGSTSLDGARSFREVMHAARRHTIEEYLFPR